MLTGSESSRKSQFFQLQCVRKISKLGGPQRVHTSDNSLVNNTILLCKGSFKKKELERASWQFSRLLQQLDQICDFLTDSKEKTAGLHSFFSDRPEFFFILAASYSLINSSVFTLRMKHPLYSFYWQVSHICFESCLNLRLSWDFQVCLLSLFSK